MSIYFRPILMQDPARPDGAQTLAGGGCWFDRAERLSRQDPPEIVAAQDVPREVLDRLTAPRAPLAGLTWDRPRLMGILNVTPDSFSDGGLFLAPDAALRQARRLCDDGADLLDIGGESTRPGAAEVAADEEAARTVPIIETLASELSVPISIDTRKAAVGRAALAAGARMLNDVSALTFDPRMAALAAESAAPICLMHARGDPATMQKDPSYDNVLLDVYDFLEKRLVAAETQGIPRAHVIVDPGIGFGKTAAHNLALIRGIGLFHGLGCVLLLGASRKRFIGAIGGAVEARARAPGSIAVALEAVSQGVQILRVHDMAETKQALRLHEAITGKGLRA